MASVIKARTFSSIVDNRIRLLNSNFARLWSSALGTSWTTIRIACRISMEDTGSGLSSTPQFIFGICSGTSNIYMDASTTHFLGIRSTEANWQRDSTTPGGYNMAQSVSNPTVSKKIGTTVTDSTSGFNTGIH